MTAFLQTTMPLFHGEVVQGPDEVALQPGESEYRRSGVAGKRLTPSPDAVVAAPYSGTIGNMVFQMECPRPLPKRQPRIMIRAGQVWVTRSPATRTSSRRVIGVARATPSRHGGEGADGKGRSVQRICYSSGGSLHNRWCNRPAFVRWITAYDAIATRTRRPRSLTLRPQTPRRP